MNGLNGHRCAGISFLGKSYKNPNFYVKKSGICEGFFVFFHLRLVGSLRMQTKLVRLLIWNIQPFTKDVKKSNKNEKNGEKKIRNSIQDWMVT